MPPTRTLRTRSSRLTRSSNSPPTRSTATIQHSSNTVHPSIRLTVKAPPSKLRNAISGHDLPPSPYGYGADSETPDPPPRPSRATRNPRTVVEADSDEDEDVDDASQDEDDVDDEENDDEMDSDNDEDEDADAEGDTLDMNEPHPPPPIIATTAAKNKAKVKDSIAVAAPPLSKPLKSVEEQEMDDDDELSDLDEDENEEPEGDEEEEEDEDEESEVDEEGGTREGTPDLTKLTKRQAAAYNQTAEEGNLMALSNEAQKKKHLTAEEISMRRAEMARRRKNLSEKRNEEEKMDTINKLLKKPAPKRRTRLEIIAAQQAAENTPSEEDGELPRPTPLYTRYVQNQSGARLGVPEEWMEKGQAIGDALRPGWAGPRRRRRLVEEVA